MMARTIKTTWSPQVTEAMDVIQESDVCFVVGHVPGKGLYYTNITKYEGGADIEVRMNALKALSALLTHELQGTTEFLAYMREQAPDGDPGDCLNITFGTQEKALKDDPAFQ